MHAARMRYCGPRGIPLSVFLRWDTYDQQAALEWQAHEAARCGSCGTHPDDWEADPQTAWHAEAYQCLGCRESEQRAESLPAVRPKGTHLRLAPGGVGACSTCSPDRP